MRTGAGSGKGVAKKEGDEVKGGEGSVMGSLKRGFINITGN